MKALHLIPSAFDYFDDIRAGAFSLIEELNNFGVTVEAFTLQYGTATASRETERTIQRSAPSRSYVGLASKTELLKALAEADLVHVHCPFLGAARTILQWKKAHPEQPLVVTYYRRVLTPDFFSFLINWYVIYYLPKIFAVADVITCFSQTVLIQSLATRYRDRIVEVDDSPGFFDRDLTYGDNGVKLNSDERLAVKYVMLYTELLGSESGSSKQLASVNNFNM